MAGQPHYEERGRDWEGKAHAKSARHEDKAWSGHQPQHSGWKGDSTWDKPADPPYSTKHQSWRDKPDSDWHHSPHKGEGSTYWQAAKNPGDDEKAAMASRIEMMETEMNKMKEWHRKLG